MNILLNSLHLNGHIRVSLTDLKVRTALYSILCSTTWKYCSIAFIWMVSLGFHSQTLKLELPIVQYPKQYHMKILLNSFHLNYYTLVTVSPTDLKVTTTLNRIINNPDQMKVLLDRFHLNGHTRVLSTQLKLHWLWVLHYVDFEFDSVSERVHWLLQWQGNWLWLFMKCLMKQWLWWVIMMQWIVILQKINSYKVRFS